MKSLNSYQLQFLVIRYVAVFITLLTQIFVHAKCCLIGTEPLKVQRINKKKVVVNRMQTVI